MPRLAIGLPDPAQYGDLSKVAPGQLLDWIVQRHRARRAGEHYDVRMGSPEMGLFSWAVRKGMPQPGQKHLAIRQPLHEHGYKSFEGEIPSGYGAGHVSKHDEGRVLITKVSPTSIHFTTAHHRYPERYLLTRGADPNKWLLINTTKTEVIPHDKVRYTNVPAKQVDSILSRLAPGSTVQAKIDGAAALTKLFKDHVEVVSYRAAKDSGRPIVHTERVFHGRPDLKIPSDLVGSILRGELYGVDSKGKAIPPQQLGGLLNSAIGKSIEHQQAGGIKLKKMLFDIQQLGNKPVSSDVSYAQRRAMLERVLSHLPSDVFHLPEEAKTAPEAMKLWKRIVSGQHPLTREGIVIHPAVGTPQKVKLRQEYDVYVRDIFPGMGKYQGVGAGGFRYSHTPTGPIVGKVGTGLSDELRKEMRADPQAFIGRVAKVLAQEKLPSGALRAPSLHALHEDYPLKAAQAAVDGLLGSQAIAKVEEQVERDDSSVYCNWDGISVDAYRNSSQQTSAPTKEIQDFQKNGCHNQESDESRLLEGRGLDSRLPQSWAEAEKDGNWHLSVDLPSIPCLVARDCASSQKTSLSTLSFEKLGERAAKLVRHSKLDQLLQAKAESDRRNYKAKHAIMRKLIAAAPAEFMIDSMADGLVGLTHIPTGFRMHLPIKVLPTVMIRQGGTYYGRQEQDLHDRIGI